MAIPTTISSGANDGAGPAAAVVAAGKLAVGAAAATAFKYSGAKDAVGKAGELLSRGEGKRNYGVPGLAARGIAGGAKLGGSGLAATARQFRERLYGDE